MEQRDGAERTPTFSVSGGVPIVVTTIHTLILTSCVSLWVMSSSGPGNGWPENKALASCCFSMRVLFYGFHLHFGVWSAWFWKEPLFVLGNEG